MTKTTVPLVGRDGNGGIRPASTESVADILERELDTTIHAWMELVEKEPELSRIPLNYQERTGHLPKLLHDVIARLRLDKGTRAPISVAAGHHGDLRCKQGYTVANVVDESRILQVSIFTTLHKNTNRVEFRKLLPDVVIIADEVDAQLKQQMLRFMAARRPEGDRIQVLPPSKLVTRSAGQQRAYGSHRVAHHARPPVSESPANAPLSIQPMT